MPLHSRSQNNIYFDEQAKDEIKKIPITDILQDMYGINVKQTGKNRAVCAIRSEKTPSCHLYLDTNTYCDFGDANRGGDTIALVQQLSNVDSYEAMKILANNYGITPKEVSKSSLPTNAQYRKIGIYADMVSKNFDLDIDKYGVENTQKFVSKYQEMTVQDLEKLEPKTYHNMLRAKAIPYVNNLRKLYYMDIYTSHSLSQEFGIETTDNMQESIKTGLKELEQAENILKKAITNPKMLSFTPPHYNISTDLKNILSGKIELEVGPVDYIDLKISAAKQNKKLIYKKVPYGEWIKQQPNITFESAAFLNGNTNEVNIITDSSNRTQLDKLFSVKEQKTEQYQTKQQPKQFNTVVVNMFAGPGAGKTTCAWAVASSLKEKGLVVEYVPEVAKEYVWDNRLDMLDGSLKNQTQLFEEQDRRVQRLMGKVEVIVTDSPILLNSVYLQEPNTEFDKEVLSRFKNQNNFNVFVERGKQFETTGRIHDYADSVRIDTQIQDLLSDNDIYYKKYTYPQISRCVENINYYVKKVNGRTIKSTKNYIEQYCKKSYDNTKNFSKEMGLEL